MANEVKDHIIQFEDGSFATKIVIYGYVVLADPTMDKSAAERVSKTTANNLIKFTWPKATKIKI